MASRSIRTKHFVMICRLALIWLVAGCAASAGSQAGNLLAQDYQKMSNAQLTAYEQQLSDEIAGSSESSGPGLSIGFGIGSWGNHSGGGIGIGQSVGGGGGAPVELRDRREAVRFEMRRRGLLPNPSAAQ